MDNSKENQLIIQTTLNKISKDVFLKIFPRKFDENYVYDKIIKSDEDQDSNELELALLAIYLLEYYDFEKFSNLFRNLLKYKWHNQQENIVDLLVKKPNINNIDTLYVVAITNYNRPWDEGIESLAIKCIWGLKKINTEESWEAIKKLSNFANLLISKEARNHLKARKNSI